MGQFNINDEVKYSGGKLKVTELVPLDVGELVVGRDTATGAQVTFTTEPNACTAVPRNEVYSVTVDQFQVGDVVVTKDPAFGMGDTVPGGQVGVVVHADSSRLTVRFDQEVRGAHDGSYRNMAPDTPAERSRAYRAFGRHCYHFFEFTPNYSESVSRLKVLARQMDA